MEKKFTRNLKKSSGFTLIELLVVIAIIGLLATMSVVALSSAREKARDSRRLSDIKQVQTALEMYYSENGQYATSTAGGGALPADLSDIDLGQYMEEVPKNPTPSSDGDCPSGADYQYNSADGSEYTIMYCLGNDTNDIEAGTNCATESSIATSSTSGHCGGFSGW